jgi:hypothetical protein
MAGGYGAGRASFAVDFVGVDTLQARLQATREGLTGPQMRRANLAAARIMAAAARASAPRRSGRLAATVRPRASTRTARVAVGGPGVPYAGVIHWGTPRWRREPPMNIQANPWVSQAAQATEPVWTFEYWQYVQNLLDRNV